tara:strand:+ start:1657 stop:2340 length:684 start_codon:yes stop_codon:yes gene_type:complete
MRILALVLILSLFLVGCAVEDSDEVIGEVLDDDASSEDVITDVSDVEVVEDVGEGSVDVSLSAEISEVLAHGSRLKSYAYNYRGPDSGTVYAISVKGDKIKIELPEMNVEERGKFYNLIYLDTAEATAEAYCKGHSSCEGAVGKIKDLNYLSVYLDSPFDWLAQITEAEKIGEKQVEGRDTITLETNVGTMTVESYYGFLYRIDNEDKAWIFSDASFNSVKDSEVTP